MELIDTARDDCPRLFIAHFIADERYHEIAFSEYMRRDAFQLRAKLVRERIEIAVQPLKEPVIPDALCAVEEIPLPRHKRPCSVHGADMPGCYQRLLVYRSCLGDDLAKPCLVIQFALKEDLFEQLQCDPGLAVQRFRLSIELIYRVRITLHAAVYIRAEAHPAAVEIYKRIQLSICVPLRVYISEHACQQPHIGQISIGYIFDIVHQPQIYDAGGVYIGVMHVDIPDFSYLSAYVPRLALQIGYRKHRQLHKSLG